MADIVSPQQRSRNMSAIRSKDTKPEVYLRKLLFAKGYRYRKNAGNVYGHPDLWLAKYKAAVFVNGCYWHRHEGCRLAYNPKSNVEFWQKKFDANIARDKKVREELAASGYRQLIVWECTVRVMMKDDEFRDQVLKDIETFFDEEKQYMEI